MQKIVVMGVSGSGKSTLGVALAHALGATFIDADDLHPAENVAHMAAGRALTDAMRWPWLDRCADAMAQAGDVVLACSALRRAYRDRLRAGVAGLRLVHIEATPDLTAARMADRAGHFMPTTLLDSQFATLEPPDGTEAPIISDPALPVAEQVADILTKLREV
ncbi:gluconokinase [Loktanella sp. IMCC34160]|uniref:gluconokinase n=1 Tax=Loktanella sp. IMCC34160 TaxID=2510646 RepID=UPI00101D420C|nr:gluconokinase [Loktanella sp. IMCC34160]RYG91536.1 gluconokinase [Loktanella sp. IMCC34160]